MQLWVVEAMTFEELALRSRDALRRVQTHGGLNSDGYLLLVEIEALVAEAVAVSVDG